MIIVKTVQVVLQDAGSKLAILGAVVDPSELAKLQGEESAMPIGASMRECTAAVDSEIGIAYVMGEPLVRAPLSPFIVDAYHARAARRDASYASMHVDDRPGGAAWEPEAAKIAKRTAEAVEAREKQEAAKADAKR